MRYLIMPSHDIRTNLATEQYLMSKADLDVPCMLFYIEKPCVIVGRNQNVLEEIDQKFCEENQVTVTRRLSGGGTMYQDMGNLCFSFIVPADKQEFGEFEQLVDPIIQGLHAMGATSAQVNGRNDLEIDGKKFSGNAMYTKNGRTFSHGTLMFDMDLDHVQKALTVSADKIASKGIKSVRSRVTNVKPYLDAKYQTLDTVEFLHALLQQIYQVDTWEEVTEHEFTLTAADQVAIDQLVAEIYGNWDWVYGRSPKFTIQKRQRFPGGTIDARYLVDKGYLKEVKIYGDFFGQQPVTDLETALIGQKYTEKNIQTILQSFDLTRYFLKIPPQDIVKLLSE